MPNAEDASAEQPASDPDRQQHPDPITYELRSIDHLRQACRRLLGPSFDYESVATDIWIEAWFKHGCTNTALVPVPYIQIKRRCVDVRRRRTLEQAHTVDRDQTSPADQSVPNGELVGLILDRAGLTPNEREVAFRRLVDDQSTGSIAKELGTSEANIRRALTFALDKLKSAMRSTEP